MARKALLLFLIFLSISNPVQAENYSSLTENIQAVRQASGSDESMKALYLLRDRLSLGEISMDSKGATELTHFLLDLAFESEYSVQRMIARQMLVQNPHPAAESRLKKYLETETDDPLKLRDTAIQVLALVHSESVLNLLVEDLQAGQSSTIIKAIKRMVDLGDYRAAESLVALQADSLLTTRLAEGHAERLRQHRNSPSDSQALKFGQRESRKVLTATTNALNKLQLMHDHGIRCEFNLPAKAMDKLGHQGALVMPWPKNEMYEWYDEKYPFVTTDFIYHTHMILVRAAIDELESLSMKENLGILSAELAQGSLGQAEKLKDKSLKKLALNNAALMLVPAVLCGAMDLDQLDLDMSLRSMVEAELARIRSAQYHGLSPLLDVEEDYTEYKCAGSGSNRNGEAGFFQARTWLGRAAFPVSSKTKTQRALLLVHATLIDYEVLTRWQDLDALATFLAGSKDDPDVLMYFELAESISGLDGLDAVMDIIHNEKHLAQFMAKAQQWPAPTINTGVNPDRESSLGFRFLGQRSSPDGVIFQELLEEGKWPVSGTQVVNGLFRTGRTIANAPGVMTGYVDCHKPLFDLSPDLLPVFKSALWQDKITNSCLGAWAESRHVAAPYLKNAHTYSGLSMMTDGFHGYVEPVPHFYRQLKLQAEAWHKLFVKRDLYPEIEGEMHDNGTVTENLRLDSKQWPRFISILDQLADLADREILGKEQTVQDGVFLKSLGKQLRHLSFNHSSMNVAEEPMARIIGVAADYQYGQVLKAGVGHAVPLYVAVPYGEKTIICRGAVYSYHELLLSPQNHLDDHQWGGLSAGQSILDKEPWLAEASELMYQPLLKREELQKLSQFTKEIPHMSLGRRFPWRDEFQSYQGAPPWSGCLANAEDTDILLEMAGTEDLAPKLHLFVNHQLSRFAAQPEVLAYWRSFLDLVGSGQNHRYSMLKDINIMRTFWALQVLAQYGNQSDWNLLRPIEGKFKEFPRGNRKYDAWLPALDWSLKYAQQQTGNGK